MRMKKAMLVLPMLALAVLSVASVMAAETCQNPAVIPRFSISADGGVLSNIGPYSNFSFTKASADIWTNGKLQSQGGVMLTAVTQDKKRVNLNLHLSPVGLACDDDVWSFIYLARGTYWVQGSAPKSVYVWVDYTMDNNAKTISLVGQGIDGLNFSVSNMPFTSKI